MWQSVWRLCTTVYTFVLVASLKPALSKVRKEELDDDHDHENNINREFDEDRRAKLIMPYDIKDKVCNTIKDDIDLETETEASVYEPSEEHVKQVKKNYWRIFDEVENDMNVDVVD